MSLLTTAELGAVRATQAKRQLARVWNEIAECLDGDTGQLTSEGKLVWMPAHQTAAMIGERKVSNGRKLSTVDWRANRLADALAKGAAGVRRAPKAVLRLLDSSAPAVKYSASLLGRVTFSANNHLVTVISPDGTVHKTVTRDASQVPRTYKRKGDAELHNHAPASKSAKTPTAAWSARCAPSTNPIRLHNVRERAVQAACTMRRVDEIGSSAACSGRLGVAGDRVEQVRQRVRERLANAG